MKYFAWWRDAEYFYEDGKKQGLQVGSTPKAGAILCWEGSAQPLDMSLLSRKSKPDGQHYYI